LGTLAALAVVLTPIGAGGTTTKPYKAVFSPSSVNGGATNVGITLTITNLASPQSLGSVNVTTAKLNPTSSSSPAFTITGASTSQPGATVDLSGLPTLVKLRNLNLGPGGTLTVQITVTTPCTAGDYTWGLQAKQSNDFNGQPGNDFTPTADSVLKTTVSAGGCHVAFLTQPKDTQVGHTITTGAFSSGGPIKVGLLNASNQPIASCPDSNTANCKVTMAQSPSKGVLGGTVQQPLQLVSDADGAGHPGLVASFGDLSISTGNGLASSDLPATFALVASGLGTSDTSTSFAISQAGTSCVGQDACEVSTALDNNTLVDVVGSPAGAFTFIALNKSVIPSSVFDPTNPAAGCRYFSSVGAGGFEETDGRTGSGELLLTYDVPTKLIQKSPNNGQPFIPLCAGAKKLVNNQPVNCDAPGGAGGPPWVGKELAPDGTFTGGLRDAKCGDGGYWWGILGTFQDPIDPSLNPTITGWGSTTIGGVSYRQMFIRVPSGWDWQLNG
jgi:hypothetical protein